MVASIIYFFRDEHEMDDEWDIYDDEDLDEENTKSEEINDDEKNVEYEELSEEDIKTIRRKIAVALIASIALTWIGFLIYYLSLIALVSQSMMLYGLLIMGTAGIGSAISTLAGMFIPKINNAVRIAGIISAIAMFMFSSLCLVPVILNFI